MNKNLFEDSANTCAYLCLKFAQFGWHLGDEEVSSFVAENLQSWLDGFPINDADLENEDAIDAIRRALKQELLEGTCLEIGTDAFVEKLEDFVGAKDHFFVHLVKEVISETANDAMRHS